MRASKGVRGCKLEGEGKSGDSGEGREVLGVSSIIHMEKRHGWDLEGMDGTGGQAMWVAQHGARGTVYVRSQQARKRPL